MLAIPLQPRTARERRVLAMRWAGATYSEITAETGLSKPQIAAIQKRFDPALLQKSPAQVEAREDEVRRRLARGDQVADIAFALGVHPQTIYAIKKRAPYSERERVRVGPSFDVEEAARLFETGRWTLQALGDRYNVTRERVRQVLYEAGVATKSQIIRHLFDEAWDDIVQMYEAGADYDEIVAKHPLPRKMVVDRMRAEGRTRPRGYARSFDYEEVARHYRALQSTIKVAALMGMTQTNVHRVLNTHYPDLLKRRGVDHKVDYAEIARLYREHRSGSRVAELLGVSNATVSRVLNLFYPELLGKPANPPAKTRTNDAATLSAAQVVKEIDAGAKPGEIAAKYGVSLSGLIRLCRAEGVRI